MIITIDTTKIETSEEMQDQIIHVLNSWPMKSEPVVKGLVEYYNVEVDEKENKS